ncbi:MAG TPA: TIGR02996 domain-containing protein [Kofleriaceae bacterium]|nr:TIGR02996 domain-containing protein [Kofleriaceae bacterium]
MPTLREEIYTSPDDDAPRLVYADQLIDAGDPRGTFIAQQCALAKLDELDERYPVMLASTHRLAAAHARVWLAPYLDTADVAEHAGRISIDRFANARFVRGFLQRIAMRPETIATAWPVLRAHEPIEGVELVVGDGVDRSCEALVEPRAFRVLAVRPDAWFTADSIGRVLAWGMPDLRELDLSGCDVSVNGARILANLPTDLGVHFEGYVAPPPFAPGQLRVLVLENAQIGDEGARILFAADHLAALETLDLTRCRIAEVETLAALRDAPAMRSVRRFSLAGNNALGEHVGVLADWGAFGALTSLALPQSTTVDAFARLFREPSTSLRALALASAKELARAPGLFDAAVAFTRLDLGTTSLGDDGFRALVAAPSTRHLLHLRVNGCSLSDRALDALVASPLDRLVTLDLSSNKLTDAGLRTLAAWPGLAHVTHLRLGNNRKLTAAGIRTLRESPHFQPVELDLGKLADS